VRGRRGGGPPDRGDEARRFAGVAASEPFENADILGVTLEITKPALLPDLVACLEENGCATRTVDHGVCHVTHAEAVDAVEEWNEVRFFVQAWQARQGGVEVTLRPDEPLRRGANSAASGSG
jgi:hypothetical protein